MLIIARGVQGLGAALVSPAALSIITTTFAEGKDRTRAMGVWGAIAGAGGAFGLLLGGILTDVLSWPWIFVINVPIGIGTAIAALRYVPESRGVMTHRRFDLAGAVTVTAGLIVLVYAIVKAQEKGWGLSTRSASAPWRSRSWPPSWPSSTAPLPRSCAWGSSACARWRPPT